MKSRSTQPARPPAPSVRRDSARLRFNFRLPVPLVRRIDEHAVKHNCTRTAALIALTEQALKVQIAA